MAEDRQLDETILASILDAEIRSAKRYVTNDLAAKRASNIEYYNGTMADAPSAPNRSAAMSRDVTDTISWVLPGVIRVFTASDNMAIYEPTTERDREFAQQATDYINYVFFKDNEGYRTLYNATHDSLLVGNGIVRHYWDPTPKVEVTTHSRLTLIQLVEMMEDEGVEILTREQNDETDVVEVPDPETGQTIEQEVPTFNVKVQRTINRGHLCVEAGKPENFFLDPEATTLDEARFAAYRHDNKTRSDLVQMGFDREIVADLASDGLTIDAEEGLARDRDMLRLRNDMVKAAELIDLYECYLQYDVDGDGVTETVQCWYAGDAGAGKVLAWDVWEDELPFSDIPCYPVPHRWDADSVADRTRDIQKIKTVLLRQGLDNLYASNLPQREVEQGSVQNPDILVNPKFGGLIWKKPGSAPIVPHVIPFVADKVFTALDYMDMIVAKRTGVSRTTMALDPEALQNQTATANQNQRDAGYSQIELVARNMAELGWTRVFRQMLKIIVKHQDRPRMIRLRDEFVEMDPRAWNSGMDVTVNVGLGTGSRDRDMLMLQQVEMDQIALIDRLMGAGAVEEAIEMAPKLVLTMKKKAESAGLKNPDSFYIEMGDEFVQRLKQKAAEAAQQPDPEMMKEQAKIEATKEIETMKAEGNAVKERAQLEADLQTKAADRENALLLEQQRQAFEREKLDAEYRFKVMQLAQEREIALLQMGMQERESEETDEKTGEKKKRPVDATAAMLMDGLGKLGGMVEAMSAMMSAPTEIVRGPDGRAVGTRKLVN